jgi:tetratricopeptide (TPR) repeat protein
MVILAKLRFLRSIKIEPTHSYFSISKLEDNIMKKVLTLISLSCLLFQFPIRSIATPSSQVLTFPDLLSQHSKNTHDRHLQIADTREFNAQSYTGDPEKREETLQRLRENIEDEPTRQEKERKEEAKSYYNRAKTSATSGNLQAAISDFDRAISLQPKYALAYFQRGMAKSKLGDRQGALADYNRAIDISPQYAEAYRQRGIAKFELDDKQGAIFSFNRAIDINPKYTNAYYWRGITKSDLDDKKGAISDYDRAIELYPKFASAYANRGIIKSDLGDRKGAIADYNLAIQINPQFANAYYSRAADKFNLGDKQGSIDDFRRAAKLYRSQGDNANLQQTLNALKQLGAPE